MDAHSKPSMYESRLTACQLDNIICSISANFCNSFTIWARNSVYNTLEALAALVANTIEYLNCVMLLKLEQFILEMTRFFFASQ